MSDKGAIRQPMKCYWTYSADMEYQDYVFAENRSKAIYASSAYSEHDVEWINCRAVRMPEFDQYHETGIPKSALLEKGWWFECYGYNERGRRCCNRLTAEDNPLTIGTEIYCNDDCRERKNGRDRADA